MSEKSESLALERKKSATFLFVKNIIPLASAFFRLYSKYFGWYPGIHKLTFGCQQGFDIQLTDPPQKFEDSFTLCLALSSELILIIYSLYMYVTQNLTYLDKNLWGTK